MFFSQPCIFFLFFPTILPAVLFSVFMLFFCMQDLIWLCRFHQLLLPVSCKTRRSIKCTTQSSHLTGTTTELWLLWWNTSNGRKWQHWLISHLPRWVYRFRVIHHFANINRNKYLNLEGCSLTHKSGKNLKLIYKTKILSTNTVWYHTYQVSFFNAEMCGCMPKWLILRRRI